MASHQIAWIDIPSENTEASSKFYADVFGWQTYVDQASNYHMFTANPGPGGGFVDTNQANSTSEPKKVMLYINTDDIDASLAAITAAGGKADGDKILIPGMLSYAFFTDPDGNRLGLMQNAADYTPGQ